MRSERLATTCRLCSTIRTVRLARDAADQRDDAVDVLVAHARHRLVEQQHFRIERERGGDLERALAAIGDFARDAVGEVGEPDIVEQRPCARALSGSSTRLERQKSKLSPRLRCKRDAHVLERGQMRKHRRDLERAHEARAAQRRPGACAVMSRPL